jgi:hypothetical protein
VGLRTARHRVDRETLAFGLLQLLLTPFVVDYPLRFGALVGHVAAVSLVSGASILLLRLRETPVAPYSDWIRLN